MTATESGLAAERAGEPPRDAAMMLCLRAWIDLGTCRQIGMALGPIPATAVWQWCAVERLDPEAARIVREVIRVVDGEFMARLASRQRIANITGGQ